MTTMSTTAITMVSGTMSNSTVLLMTVCWSSVVSAPTRDRTSPVELLSIFGTLAPKSRRARRLRMRRTKVSPTRPWTYTPT